MIFTVGLGPCGSPVALSLWESQSNRDGQTYTLIMHPKAALCQLETLMKKASRVPIDEVPQVPGAVEQPAPHTHTAPVRPKVPQLAIREGTLAAPTGRQLVERARDLLESLHDHALEAQVHKYGETLHDICHRYATHATELSARIEHFQSWLSKLAGKAPVKCWKKCDERKFLGLQYVRSGDWELQCTWVTAPPGLGPQEIELFLDSHAEWNSLLRSSVELKTAVIELFPDLMKAFSFAAAKRTTEVMEAMQKFDAFAMEFGVNEGVQ